MLKTLGLIEEPGEGTGEAYPLPGATAIGQPNLTDLTAYFKTFFAQEVQPVAPAAAAPKTPATGQFDLTTWLRKYQVAIFTVAVALFLLALLRPKK
jgi:hypothetical protein